MNAKIIFFTTALLMIYCDILANETISVSSELARMRSIEHLYRPQNHTLKQYSGFCRKGGNPDRFDCLYVEEGWRVIADHKGPGVVTRIWTAQHEEFDDIRVEVDGEIIFSGKANEFFDQGKLPFAAPLSLWRNHRVEKQTIEGEAQGMNYSYAVSYVPIPFKKQFRYMTRQPRYSNINIKAYPPGQPVESFLDAEWEALEPEISKTVEVWKSMNLYDEGLQCFRKTTATITVPAAQKDSYASAVASEISGPGIIRGIHLKAKEDNAIDDLYLKIYWDGSKSPSIVSPLDYGFGSRAHRTLAIGQSDDGWRFCLIPMPFKEKASIQLVSRSTEAIICDVKLLVEENVSLPTDVLYLNSYKNEGFFPKGGQVDKPDLPLEDFFYHNGYTALDFKGAGHVVAYMDRFHCQPELDEHVFIDDERTFPDNSWNGTGHEDLFDMAWGHKYLSSPMTSGGSQDFKEVNVKLFWNAPMTFRKSIRFNWEWIYKFSEKSAPRDARFASCVYWYAKP